LHLKIQWSIYTIIFNIHKFYLQPTQCIFSGSQNKLRLFSHTTSFCYFLLFAICTKCPLHGRNSVCKITEVNLNLRRSQMPRGLSRTSAAVRLLRLWVGIAPEHGRLSVVSRVVRWRSLRRADHLSREVLPTVVRRYVRARNLVNEKDLARRVLLRQKETSKF